MSATYRVQPQRNDDKQKSADAPPHIFVRGADDGKAQPAQHHQHVGKHQEKCFLKFGLGKDAHDDQRQRRCDHPVYVSRPKDETPLSCHKNTVAASHGKVRKAADCSAKEGYHKYETTSLFLGVQLIIKEQKRCQCHACCGNKQKVLVRVVEILRGK
jgi:hypothetical protein